MHHDCITGFCGGLTEKLKAGLTETVGGVVEKIKIGVRQVWWRA